MASDYWGLVIAGANALAQGYMAKKNVDAQKKDAQHAQDEWERAMQMQQQNMYDARNSPFAKVGMTMLDQMLHVYGDQSKGRGGFTLPVDQLSSMLGGFGSFGSVEDNRQNQQTIGGFNPDNSSGWYGPGNGNPAMGSQRELSPEMRAVIEERKQAIADARALGLPGISQGGGSGIRAHGGIQRASDQMGEGGLGYQSSGGGAPSFDQLFDAQHQMMGLDRRSPNYVRSADEEAFIKSLGGGSGAPNRWDTAYASDAKRFIPDAARDAAWWRAGLDGNPMGQGSWTENGWNGAARNAYEMGVNKLTGAIPIFGTPLQIGGAMIDRNAPNYEWMWNYKDMGNAPSYVQEDFNKALMEMLGRNSSLQGGGYGYM